MPTTRNNITVALQSAPADDPPITLSLSMPLSAWSLVLDVLDVGAASPDRGGVASDAEREVVNGLTEVLRDELDANDQSATSKQRYVVAGESAYYPKVTTLTKPKVARKARRTAS